MVCGEGKNEVGPAVNPAGTPRVPSAGHPLGRGPLLGPSPGGIGLAGGMAGGGSTAIPGTEVKAIATLGGDGEGDECIYAGNSINDQSHPISVHDEWGVCL